MHESDLFLIKARSPHNLDRSARMTFAVSDVHGVLIEGPPINIFGFIDAVSTENDHHNWDSRISL